MGRHKEGVLYYPKYCPFKIIKLNPARITLDQCREIISNHVGSNSTFFIEAGTKTIDIIRPQTLFDAKNLDLTDRQNFLTKNANVIKEANRVFIKTSHLRLYRN